VGDRARQPAGAADRRFDVEIERHRRDRAQLERTGAATDVGDARRSAERPNRLRTRLRGDELDRLLEALCDRSGQSSDTGQTPFAGYAGESLEHLARGQLGIAADP